MSWLTKTLCSGVVLASACVFAQTTPGTAPKPAEPAVQANNAALLGTLPFANRADFDDAARGFIATLPDALVRDGERTVWSVRDYAFLQQDKAPATVNPSLWRQAQLNYKHGLFKVADRIYQVRGFDISNMTLIETDNGVVVIDPLTSIQVAKAGLDLYYANRPRKPVVAVIYTHSHADHFGGVKGVITEADAQSGKVKILAPDGFMEHSVSENVIAGSAMNRRANYQFGLYLPKGERMQVDAGLGKAVSLGTISLIAPNDVITKSGERRTIDGLEIVFQLAPGTEAPAEMHLYFPQLRALNMAENVTHNLHNLLPLRGAEVRDPLGWSKYISEAIELFGDKTDVLLAQHHWPTWGRERVVDLMKKQRDLYKYIHDQTLRMLNQGFNAVEIAEALQLPPALANEWASRGYYGTVNHNVKAIYQRYLGWYDANPANLNPLPPVATGKKFVEYMGGAAAVIQRARDDFKQGNYRWVAQVMNQVVFAEPENRDARELAADAMEQLGYQAESATWRNAYLIGAQELRNGVPPAAGVSTLSPDLLQALTVDMYFDLMGVRLNGPKADGKRAVINWNFTDTRQQYVLNLENSALTYVSGRQAASADLTLTLTRKVLDAITLRQTTFQQAMGAGDIKLDGNPAKLAELLGMLDNFNPRFEIVEPKKAAAQ